MKGKKLSIHLLIADASIIHHSVCQLKGKRGKMKENKRLMFFYTRGYSWNIGEVGSIPVLIFILSLFSLFTSRRLTGYETAEFSSGGK